MKVTLDPDAGALNGEHLFRANSMYDPDFTGVGNQPRGFDQWMALYHRFHVIGSKIRARFATTTTETVPALCGISMSRGGNSNLGIAVDNIEKWSGGSKVLLPAGNNVAVTKAKFSTKKFYKVKNILDNQQLSGTATTDPSWCAYYHVWVQPMNTSVNLNAVVVDVTVEYLAVLTEPVDVGRS